MTAKITIVAEGEQRYIGETEKNLALIKNARIEKAEVDRGIISTAVSAGKWIMEYAGDIGKLVDTLIKLKNSQPEGMKLKIKHGDLDVEIDNMHRDQLITVLNEIKKFDTEAATL